MALFFSKLPPEPLDENLLVNGINNKQNDQGDEAENSFLQLDSEQALHVFEERREGQRKNSNGQEQNDEERKAPAPPIFPFNSAEIRHQGAIWTFRVGDSRLSLGLTDGKLGLFLKVHPD